MTDLLVVRSKLKECTKCNIAGDVADSLSEKVKEIMKIAEKRATENGRKTIKRYDL